MLRPVGYASCRSQSIVVLVTGYFVEKLEGRGEAGDAVGHTLGLNLERPHPPNKTGRRVEPHATLRNMCFPSELEQRFGRVVGQSGSEAVG